MKRPLPPARMILAAALALTGCASPTWKRLTKTDGLLDALTGASAEIDIPIERVSGNGGQVATAHLRAYGNVFVSGLVRRQSFINPAPWAHVDVIVLDSHQRIVESVAVNYLPREIPHGQRSGFPQSHYTARLAALPAPGSTVKVIFHSAHRDECEFARKL